MAFKPWAEKSQFVSFEISPTVRQCSLGRDDIRRKHWSLLQKDTHEID